MVNRISGVPINRMAFERNVFQRVTFGSTQGQQQPLPAPAPTPAPPVATPGAVSPGKPSPAKPAGVLPGLPVGNRNPDAQGGGECSVDPNATLPACFA